MRLPLIAALVIVLALPAAAQTARSTAGNVGSAAVRGVNPGTGGAAVLPSLTTSGTASTANVTSAAVTGGANPSTAATTAISATGAGINAAGRASGRGGSGRGISAGSATSGGTATATSGGGSGSGNWILCPPTGSSAPAPLLDGTDLSCAPR